MSEACYGTINRVPAVLVLIETEVVAHLFPSSPAPELSAQFIVLKLFLAIQVQLSVSASLFILVHSFTYWVSFIATSTSLYSHAELYKLKRL